MNIEKDLKKDGITVEKPLDTLSVTLIAKFVAEKLISSFPFYGFNYDNLFIKIVNVPMYIANIPDNMGQANYFYKNSSIYFKNGLTLDEMKEFAVHEFIHYYQEVKDKNNVLYKLGLCDFTGFKVRGMALNEGAVQLIASRALKTQEESVKYYGIEFSSSSPYCYPVICNLVNQMAYITGENVLFDSTFNSNSNFVKAFTTLCGKKAFEKIQTNLDGILDLEEKIGILSAQLEDDSASESFIAKASIKIGSYKNDVNRVFFETQQLIMTSYFDKASDNLYSEQEIEDFRRRLYNYKDLIGSHDNYSFFNDYYINMMTKLDDKFEALNNIGVELVPYKRSIIQIILEKVHSLLRLPRVQEVEEQKTNE